MRDEAIQRTAHWRPAWRVFCEVGRNAIWIIASDGQARFGVDRSALPEWDEMCFVKDLFWRDDECVVQFHPPRAEYVNYHPNCLHLWKPVGRDVQTPPSILVGPKKETAA